MQEGHRVVGIDNLNNYYNPVLKNLRLREVIGRLNPNFVFYKGDICQKDFLKTIFAKFRFDSIIHLAAQAGVRYSLENPSVYEKSNLEGTLNILEMARNYHHPRLIFGSSSSVYGNSKIVPFSEDNPCNDQISLYGATKKSGELMFKAYHHLFKIPSVILRFFTVYGPWGRPDMAIYSFTEKIIKGGKIEVYGLDTKRDFTYIDDIVEGIFKALQKKLNWEIINLGNSQPVELKKLIDKLEELIGKKAKVMILPLPAGDVRTTYADISKAKKLLNWQPKTNFSQGLKYFTDWYKKEVIGNILLS